MSFSSSQKVLAKTQDRDIDFLEPSATKKPEPDKWGIKKLIKTLVGKIGKPSSKQFIGNM